MKHVKILCRNNDIDIVRVHLSPFDFDIDTARLLGRGSRHLRRAFCDQISERVLVVLFVMDDRK